MAKIKQEQAQNLWLRLLERLLQPAVRVCLRSSIRFQDFTAVGRRVFVRLAARELENQGLSPSASKLSAMTGLRRPDVVELLAHSESGELVNSGANLIAKVISVWRYDRAFTSSPGNPRALDTVGTNSEFAELVRVVSSDLNHHTVLFELIRIAAVKREGTHAVLQTSAFIDAQSSTVGLEILCDDVSDLTAAVFSNLDDQADKKNLHARTTFDNIPVAFKNEIKTWLLQFGQRIHEEARQYFARKDRDFNHKLDRNRDALSVSLGTFGFVRENISKMRKSTKSAHAKPRRRK